MVRKVKDRTEKDYKILAEERSPIGRYSGAKRDFTREKRLKEPDKDDFRRWLIDLSLKDEEFEKLVDRQWKEWTDKEGGWDENKGELYWVGQSHLDIAWEWRLAQTIEKAYVTYQKAVFHGENIENFCFAGSQALTYEFIRQKHPDLFQKIQDAHQEGNFELVGGSWVEPDCRMPSGEAFIRQRLYGQHYFLKHFGEMPKVEWTPDTFGYAWNMPQIIKKSGGDSFFTTKVWGNAEEYPDAPWPYTNFIWQGPDGSRILTHIQPQMFGPIRAWPTTRKRSKLVKEGKKIIADYLTDHPEHHPNLSGKAQKIITDLGIFYGLGDGGHGPTGKEVAVVEKWIKEGKGHYSTVQNYFDTLHKYWERLPIWNDELYFQKHQGTLTTQGMIKRGVRMLEWRTVGLEMICTLLEMMDENFLVDYGKFKQVWLDILTNHFHDIFPGSSIPEVYDDTYDHFLQDIKLLDQIEADAVKELMSQIPGTNTEKMDSEGIIVINPLGMERKEIVAIEVPKGQQTLNIQDRVRSLKLKTGQGIQEVPIQFIEGDHEVEEPLMKQTDRIEFIYDFKPFEIIFGYFHDPQSKNRKQILINESEDCITVQKRDETFTIDKHTGHIEDYSWKGRKILKKGSAALKAYADMENVWEIQHNFRDWHMEWEVISAPTVKEHGPVRSTIEYKTKFEDGESVFIHQYIFYQNMNGFESKVMVDWKDPAIFIKMEYLPTTDSEYSIAEIPGAAIKRKIKPTASHDKVRWENNCQTFVEMPSKDGQWGLAFMNDGKYGFSTEDGKFELSLLRQASIPKIADEAWCLEERRNRVEAGEEIMGVSDRHWHVIRQRIIPHEGDYQEASIFKKAHSFNVPLLGDWIKLQTADPEHKEKQPKYPRALNQFHNTIQIKNPSLEMLALKVWEPLIAKDDKGFILRIVNNSNSKTRGEIEFSAKLEVEKVEAVNFLEMEDETLDEGAVQFEIGDNGRGILHTDWNPWEIRTFLLQ